MKKKLAILGASYLQKPLVEKAQKMGLETHVFAWQEGNTVGDITDYYYPISVLKKGKILQKCKDIKIDGIISIASDIAMPTVNYVAEKLGLPGNSVNATKISTDKFEMRCALVKAGISCPKFKLCTENNTNDIKEFNFPVIVKPTDRSGSRGVTKVKEPQYIMTAVKKAIDLSIHGCAIIEEFVTGREFSVEAISYKGKHQILAITDKKTTGSPYFVEMEHHQPADIDISTENKIQATVEKALSALHIENGASHSEVFLTPNGDIIIGEVSGRMGGDLIGSEMVQLSTGYDFLEAVIRIAIDEFNDSFPPDLRSDYAGVYYVLAKPGIITDIIDNTSNYKEIKKVISIMKKSEYVDDLVDNSACRAGLILYQSRKHKLHINPSSVLKYITRQPEQV